MIGLQELLESTLAEHLAGENIEPFPLNELAAFDNDKVAGLVGNIAGLLLENIKRDAPSALKGLHQHRREFEKRVGDSWKGPLNLLDLFIFFALDAGNEFNREFREKAVQSVDSVFETLTSLHARACQVSGEVHALLRAGYADGAQARWRSLHEMAVVANLIVGHGQELAERYLLHEVIQQYKLALAYQKSFERLNDEPPSEEALERLSAEQSRLIAKFGEAFNSDYGWAASVVGNSRPTLSDLEQLVELDHMRPYYRWASNNVHPNSHGNNFRLGLPLSEQETVLLAGPSNLGLTDPGHATAISLLQITASLLLARPSFDCMVMIKVLGDLANEVGEAFLKARQELEDSETDDS